MKKLLKFLHGLMIRLFLPVLVLPPSQFYRGKIYTIHRIYIMRFLESWQDRIHGRVLDIGAGTWDYPRQLFKAHCEYLATDIHPHVGIELESDIHKLSETFEEGTFDFVICTEVLEHVPRPWEALSQVRAVIKPGGVLLLTTPFNFHLHGNEISSDFWRFTAQGLKFLLLEEAGFKQAEITPTGHPEFPFSYLVIAYR